MLFTTMIPVADNDGNEFPPPTLQDVFDRLAAVGQGSTVDGPTQGTWIDPDSGETFRDECWRVKVSCEREQLEAARQLVLQIGDELEQLAMYFEVQYYDGVQILKVK